MMTLPFMADLPNDWKEAKPTVTLNQKIRRHYKRATLDYFYGQIELPDTYVQIHQGWYVFQVTANDRYILVDRKGRIYSAFNPDPDDPWFARLWDTERGLTL